MPQLLQRFTVNINKQIKPKGKKKMAMQMPKQVKLSTRTPTRHAGQPPSNNTGLVGTVVTTVVVPGAA